MDASPLDIKLLAQVGENDAYELGTITVPMKLATADRGRTVTVTLDSEGFKRRIEGVAAALAVEVTR